MTPKRAKATPMTDTPTPAPRLAERLTDEVLTRFCEAMTGIYHSDNDDWPYDFRTARAYLVAALSPEPERVETSPVFDAVMKLFKDWAVRVMLPSQFSHNDGLRFEQMARERFGQPPTEAR